MRYRATSLWQRVFMTSEPRGTFAGGSAVETWPAHDEGPQVLMSSRRSLAISGLDRADPAAWLYGPSPADSPSGNFVRYWWTDWMTDEPSPTAAATRLIDPVRAVSQALA